MFVVLCAVIISFYGGGFATVPAYLRDLSGTYQVGAIHGLLLTAWSTAGVLGPLIVNGILDTQGTPGELVAADYRPTLFGVLAVGFVANLLIRPAADRWARGERTMTGPSTEEHTPAKYEVEIVTTWLIVGIPLAYGVFNAVKAALQLVS